MQNLDETEDGEISDEASNEYVEPYEAVERPVSFAPIPFQQPILDETDESSESSTSSDSSSDERDRPAKKRRKVSTRTHIPQPQASKRNVWSSVIFEDHIEKELKDVNVQHSRSLIDKSREVESYYTYGKFLGDRLGGEDIEELKKIKNKLIKLDEKDGGDSFQPQKEESPVPDDFEQSLQETQNLLKSRKRKMDQREIEPKKKSTPRVSKKKRVEDLSVTESSSTMEVAQDIALKLHEDKIDLILRTVEIIGISASIQLFQDTQVAENEGGIFVADGSRRRTPGGVFLYLLRNHDEIPMEQIRKIFSEETKAKEMQKRFVRAKRRNEQAEKLKQSLESTGDMPLLPSRVELEMQKKFGLTATVEDGSVQPQIDEDDEENVVDIHFDCD